MTTLTTVVALCVGCSSATLDEVVRPEPSTWAAARDTVSALLAASPGVSGVEVTDEHLTYVARRRPVRGVRTVTYRFLVRLADVRQVVVRTQLDDERVCLQMHDGAEHLLPAQPSAALTGELATAAARLVELRPYPGLATDDFPPVPPVDPDRAVDPELAPHDDDPPPPPPARAPAEPAEPAEPARPLPRPLVTLRSAYWRLFTEELTHEEDAVMFGSSAAPAEATFRSRDGGQLHTVELDLGLFGVGGTFAHADMEGEGKLASGGSRFPCDVRQRAWLADVDLRLHGTPAGDWLRLGLHAGVRFVRTELRATNIRPGILNVGPVTIKGQMLLPMVGASVRVYAFEGLLELGSSVRGGHAESGDRRGSCVEAILEATFWPTPFVGVTVGYRYEELDLRHDRDSDERVDGALHGPTAGLALRF